MPTLPPAILHLLAPFAPCFSRRVWPHVLVLLAGAILAPGTRTVTAALRVRAWRMTEGLAATTTCSTALAGLGWPSGTSCWSCS